MTKILGYAVSPVFKCEDPFLEESSKRVMASAERTLSLDSTISSCVYVPAFPKA
jgi:hypothetical protein